MRERFEKGNTMQAILDDCRRVTELVRQVVHAPDCVEAIAIPLVGGATDHVDELAAELIQAHPTVLTAVSLAFGTADEAGAKAAIVEGLQVLHALRPNAFSGSGPAKALYRLCLRRTLTDRESADASADYCDIGTARREARKIADDRGWRLSEMEAEAVALDRQIRQDAIDREASNIAASRERVRIKSKLNADAAPRRQAIGTYR